MASGIRPVEIKQLRAAPVVFVPMTRLRNHPRLAFRLELDTGLGKLFLIFFKKGKF